MGRTGGWERRKTGDSRRGERGITKGLGGRTWLVFLGNEGYCFFVLDS